MATISSQFLAIYINIFRKIEVQIIILRCLTDILIGSKVITRTNPNISVSVFLWFCKKFCVLCTMFFVFFHLCRIFLSPLRTRSVPHKWPNGRKVAIFVSRKFRFTVSMLKSAVWNFHDLGSKRCNFQPYQRTEMRWKKVDVLGFTRNN